MNNDGEERALHTGTVALNGKPLYQRLILDKRYWAERGMAELCREWQEILSLCKNFTSIITYVPFNESWGIPAVLNNVDQQNFARGMYYITKAIDDSRLISLNDGWENLTETDFILIHDYASNDSNFHKMYVEDDINKIAPQGKMQFCENSEYRRSSRSKRTS